MKPFLRLMAFFLVMLVIIMTLSRRDYSGAWILFSLDQSFDAKIFLMTGDGESVLNILPDDICGNAQSWSPDGRWIAFSRDCWNQHELMIMRLGSSVSNLISIGYPVAWSPDGERLLFERGDSDLYVIDRDGRNERFLTDRYGDPTWSPDGVWLYSSASRDQGSAIERFHIETGNVEQVMTTQARFTELSWSPNGAQIALVFWYEERRELFLMNSDGSDLHRLPLDPPPERLYCPGWSADGEWIAFLADEDIYRIRSDGRDLERLTERDGYFGCPLWSPDGVWLLYVEETSAGFELYRMRADGSSPEYLAPGLYSQYAPVTDRAWHPSWLMTVAILLTVLSLVGHLRR